MATILLPPDFKEFLQLLNSERVEYLFVGGYAVGYYGYPRATGDMDVWVAGKSKSITRKTIIRRRFPNRVGNLTAMVFFAATIGGFLSFNVDSSRAAEDKPPVCGPAQAPTVVECRPAPRRFIFRRRRFCLLSVSSPAIAPGETSSSTPAEPTAAAIFAEAVAAARAAGDAKLLAEVAEAQAKAGLKEDARRTFAEATALARIHDDAEWAIIDADSDKWYALLAVAEAQVEAGLLADAIATTEKIRSSTQKNEALGKIVVAQAEAGLFDDAIANARKIKDNLCEIAVLQAKVGRTEDARRTFAEAVNAVRSQPEAFDWNYVRIASSEISAGFFDDALAFVDQVKSPRAKVTILCNVAGEQAKRGQADRATENFRAAAALAAQLEDKLRWQELLKIATAQAETKMTVEAAENFRKAAAIAVKLNDIRALLGEIADAQLKAGLTAEAAHTFRMASPIAAKLDDGKRWGAFFSMAAAQFKAKMSKEAVENLKRAKAAAAQLASEERTKYVLTIAGLEVAADLPADALATLHTIDNSKATNVINAFEVIIRAKMGRFDEAVAAAKKLPGEFRRVWCLFFIAAKEIEAGKLVQGRRLLSEAMAASKSVPEHIVELETRNYWNAMYDGPLLHSACSESMPHIIATVAVAQSKAKLFDEAAATARTLKDAENRSRQLTLIAVDLVDAQLVDQAVAILAEVKAEAPKIAYVKYRVATINNVAAVEAKAGRVEQARRTFADATAVAEGIRPNDFTMLNHWLPNVAEAEIRAGFLVEAAETCRAIEDSETKDSVLQTLAALQKTAEAKERARNISANALSATRPIEESEVLIELVAVLIGADRFDEAINEARKIEDAECKWEALLGIILGLHNAKQTDRACELTGEWLAAALQIDDLAEKNNTLFYVTYYQSELGMTREHQQTFAERIVVARQMEEKGVLVWDCDCHEGVSAFVDIAVDQASHGFFADSMATVGMIRNAQFKFWTLHKMLTRYAEKKPTDESRRISAEALAAARADEPRRFENLCAIADAQWAAGLEKESGETVAELLTIARQIKNLEERASKLCKVAVARPQKPGDKRSQPIFQEAIDNAMILQNSRDRQNAFIEISDRQSQSGLFADAAKTARRIESASERAKSLGLVAVRAEGDSAAKIFAEAHVIAKSLSDSLEKTQTLSSLMDLGINTRRYAEAATAARALKEGENKAWGLYCVANAQATLTDEKDDARKVLIEALAEARKIENADRRAWTMHFIPKALAKARFFDDAKAAAREIDASSHRSYSLRNIAVEQARQGLIADALSTARKIPVARERCSALREIAASAKSAMAR